MMTNCPPSISASKSTQLLFSYSDSRLLSLSRIRLILTFWSNKVERKPSNTP